MNPGILNYPGGLRANVQGFAICTSNSGTAYRLSEQDGLTPMPEQIFTGTRIWFKADLANTGPATLQVGTEKAYSIVKRGNAVLVAADIAAGQCVEVIFDGTNWQLLSQLGQPVIKSVKFDGVGKAQTANPTVASNVATFTLTAGHGIVAGNLVNITGYVGTAVDFNVTAAAVIGVTATTFTYPIANTGNQTPAAGGRVNTVIKSSSGIASVTAQGIFFPGDYTVNFTTAYASADYLVLMTTKGTGVENRYMATISLSDTGSASLKRIITTTPGGDASAAEIHFRAEGL